RIYHRLKGGVVGSADHDFTGHWQRREHVWGWKCCSALRGLPQKAPVLGILSILWIEAVTVMYSTQVIPVIGLSYNLCSRHHIAVVNHVHQKIVW
ncbi:unnamed protein product, partial [Mycena citricolor]